MIGRTAWRFNAVPSTQDLAFRLAELGAPHGTVVRAEQQTAGRGRQGRRWESRPGESLLMSVLLRPADRMHQLGTFSVRVGAELASEFEQITGTPAALKWPNDVLLGSRKVSGILLQTRSTPEPIAVLGIGINVSTPLELLPENATSLQEQMGQSILTDVVYEQVIAAMNRVWESLGHQLTESQITEIDDRLWLRHAEVTLQDADRQLRGIVMGVAPNGGLRIVVDGVERTVVAGELTRGPREATQQYRPENS